MAQQTFQMHLYAAEEFGGHGVGVVTKFRILPWAPDPGRQSAFGYHVGPVEVQAEVPDSFDMRAAKLAAKRAELKAAQAEFAARVTQLQREINELQAIEFVEAA